MSGTRVSAEGITTSTGRRTVAIGLLIATSAAVLGLFLAQGSRAAEDIPGGERIGFVSTRDGDDELWVMNADGTAPVQVTFNGPDPGDDADRDPVFSPQNDRFVFASNRNPADTDFEIYTMNRDGTNVVQLTNNTLDDTGPAWSPDGSKIAFATDRDSSAAGYEIYTMNADGTEQTRLTFTGTPTAEVNDIPPHWSPDGTKIVFSRDTGGGNKAIFEMNADGSEQTALTAGTTFDNRPSYSPDGKLIAFFRALTGGLQQIWVMNVDGSDQQQLTALPGDSFAPFFSLDGTQRIAFQNDPPGGTIRENIWVMNGDGTAQQQLTPTDTIRDRSPRWEPVLTCSGKTTATIAKKVQPRFGTIIGTPESEKLRGGPGDDIIIGLGGKDKIKGLGGKDLICGGNGKDDIEGGNGKDTLLGGKGEDECDGDKGKDRAGRCEEVDEP